MSIFSHPTRESHFPQASIDVDGDVVIKKELTKEEIVRATSFLFFHHLTFRRAPDNTMETKELEKNIIAFIKKEMKKTGTKLALQNDEIKFPQTIARKGSLKRLSQFLVVGSSTHIMVYFETGYYKADKLMKADNIFLKPYGGTLIGEEHKKQIMKDYTKIPLQHLFASMKALNKYNFALPAIQIGPGIMISNS